MAESRLDVVINPSRAQSGARAVKSSIDSLKNSWMEVTAKMFLAEQAVSRVWKAASAGADFEEGLERLNTQMGKFHSTAQLMINDLKNVSNGQLSNADAVQVASRAMMQGLNPDQIRTFTQAADLLGDVMGTDLKGSFDTILQGLATGRTQILANIGVYVDLEEETKNLALATNRTTDQITKQEKAAIGARAVIEQLGGTLDKFASGAVSDADRMKAIEVRFDDMTLAVGRFAKSLVIDAVDAWKTFTDFVNNPNNNPFRAAQQAIRQSTPGNIDNPATQEILGRSIVADTQGNLARKAAEPKPKLPGLDPKLRAIQVQADADRMRAQIEADRDSTILGLEHQTRLQGFDQQMGQQGQVPAVGEMDFLKSQHDTQLRVLALAGETQNKLLQLEGETYQKRVKLGFESTQEKITAEESFKTKVSEINGEIAKITQEFGNVSRESLAEQGVLELKLQEERGARIQASLTEEFRMREEARQRDHQSNQEYVQGAIDIARLEYASHEELYALERVKLQDQLAFKLRLKKEEIERLLILKQNGDQSGAIEDILGRGDQTLSQRQREGLFNQGFAQDAMLGEQQRGDLFAGWKRGMQQYVQDTKSGFGMAQDMARRTAGLMEQSFQKFFFDAFEGRVNSMKDVLTGFLDFTKQIMSQVTSQIMVKGLVNGLTNASGSLFSGGSSVGGLTGGAGDVGGFALRANGGISAFADGGIATRPMLRWAGGGLNLIGEGQHNEAYVPLPDGRTIPVTMRMPHQMLSTQPALSMPVTVNVHNENGSDVQTETSKGPDGSPQIDVYIKNIVKQGMKNGEFDPLMRQSFGTKRQPTRRG